MGAGPGSQAPGAPRAQPGAGGRDDPALADRLDALPQGAQVPVEVVPERGPLFHLRQVTLNGTVPQAGRAALQLDPGAPARAADVLAARQRVLDALRNDGYALAQV